MKTKSIVILMVFTGLSISFLFSCKKEDPKVIPTVTVKPVTNITEASASSGGEVTSEGGVSVTSRGVCWSTNQNPTTADSKTSDGTGSGSFSSSITGLSPGATYYLRAYAINSIGTGYSSQTSFGALALLPVVSTVGLSNITTTTVNSGGNITSDGGSAITARGVCWSTSQNPLITDNKTIDGTGSGSFTSNITGLNAGYTYYIRAYATNQRGTGYSEQQSLTTILADMDGNVYTTVTIGTQVWMVENLKTTKYSNGESIPNVMDKTAWSMTNTGAYCYYNNDAASFKDTYGALYNYHAVTDSRKLAPAGWHIPSENEWIALITYIGGNYNQGGKLREPGTSHWTSPNTGATNELGFTALPGGDRYFGNFELLGYQAMWWSTSLHAPGTALGFNIVEGLNAVILTEFPLGSALSVRCLKN
jgi:uncharacterized protein (TIGR02145 family)